MLSSADMMPAGRAGISGLRRAMTIISAMPKVIKRARASPKRVPSLLKPTITRDPGKGGETGDHRRPAGAQAQHHPRKTGRHEGHDGVDDRDMGNRGFAQRRDIAQHPHARDQRVKPARSTEVDDAAQALRTLQDDQHRQQAEAAEEAAPDDDGQQVFVDGAGEKAGSAPRQGREWRRGSGRSGGRRSRAAQGFMAGDQGGAVAAGEVLQPLARNAAVAGSIASG